MTLESLDLDHAFASITEYWRPRCVARLNRQAVPTIR